MGRYSYDAAAPITKLSGDQVPVAVKKLKDNATAYMTEGGDIAQQHSTRYRTTTRVTHLMLDSEIMENTSTYAYPATGQPLALLQVAGQRKDVRIVNLAAIRFCAALTTRLAGRRPAGDSCFGMNFGTQCPAVRTVAG